MNTRPRSGLRRWVVKIGSESVVRWGAAGIFRRVSTLAKEAELVIVTSGAIAQGFPGLGMRERPKRLHELQAAAAVGQVRLMTAYDQAAKRYGKTVAQVLLTHEDLVDRQRAIRAQAALTTLLGRGCIPIVNENDTVATDEIRFGDNDRLAALVTGLLGADALVLLTNVEGVLDARGKRIPELRLSSAGAPEIPNLKKSALGTGGIASKLTAARLASLAGAHVFVASSAPVGILRDLVRGRDVGTWIPPHQARLRSKKHWLLAAAVPKGSIALDAGAIRVVQEQQKSVLAVGVKGVEGIFASGDVISLVDEGGVAFAKGVVRASSAEMSALLGKAKRGVVVVHRDDLALSLSP